MNSLGDDLFLWLWTCIFQVYLRFQNNIVHEIVSPLCYISISYTGITGIYYLKALTRRVGIPCPFVGDFMLKHRLSVYSSHVEKSSICPIYAFISLQNSFAGLTNHIV